MDILEKVKVLSIGAAGIASSAGVDIAANMAPLEVNDWTAAITQVVIAIATLIGLLKRRKRA